MRKIICIMLAAASFSLVGCKTATHYSRSTGEAIDDATIKGSVGRGLSRDSLTKGADIDVASFRGHVHLTGFVDHPVQRERASEITRTIPGVAWFKNDIIVKNDMPMAQGAFMSESAGAQRSSSSMSSSGGQQWQRGSAFRDRQGYPSASRGQFRDSSGAQREVEVETPRGEVEVETEREGSIEQNQE